MNARAVGDRMPSEAWLDSLIEHEVAYMAMVAQCERTEHALFLHAPDLPTYHDANRAVRLRTGDRSAEWVAREVARYYKGLGLVATADVDSVAEEQGIGAALRAIGIRPIAQDRLLMRWGLASPPPTSESGVEVTVIQNETGAGEAADWIATAVADDIGWPDELLWRSVASAEARYDRCRLYLGSVDATPAGACDLFEYARWGRIDSVVTKPQFRRRGVATALVLRAVADSLTSGSLETYLFTEPNSAAERLYSRIGFTPWHRNVFQQHRG